MKNVVVFCGSSLGNQKGFREQAQMLGLLLGESGIGLVYGGAKVGLMGSIADAALAAGGSAIGVLPRFLGTKEIAHDKLTRLILVDTMHERKAKMAELGDGFIALPGGFGTLEEIFELLTWAQLGLHQKPIGILNVQGYYDFLLSQLDSMVQNGLLQAKNRALVLVSDSPEGLIEDMENYRPVATKKWIKDVDQT